MHSTEQRAICRPRHQSSILRDESAVRQATGESGPESSLRVQRVRSIREVDERLWDSLNAHVDLFHTHRFIRSLEDGHGDAQFWYLLLYQGEQLVGTAALSCFDVSLDLFLSGAMQRTIGFLRRFVPSLLRLRVLFCGLPISIGKHSIAFAPGVDSRPVIGRLVKEMEWIARLEGTRFLCVKEFMSDETTVMDELCKHGFMRAPSLPYARLPLRWSSFDAYLAEMRHGYRRPILKSMKKVGLPGTGKESRGAQPAGEARLVVGGTQICSPQRFHELYSNVMRRAGVKLEVLPLHFFDRLNANLDGELQMIAVTRGLEVLGAALCAVSSGRMTFLLTGLDYASRDQYDVYFNLVYGIVRAAIEQGCTTLDLGQTSEWVKSRMGAEFIPGYFYLRSESSVTRHILKAFRRILFPVVKPPVLRVLKGSKAEPVRPRLDGEDDA